MRPFLSSCVCVLLICSGPLIYAKKPPKPAAGAKQPAGVATSPTRKLKISGMNAGLDGILKIETALTMKGPLLISVLNGAHLVKQSNSDATGRMVRQLDPGETTYMVSLALGPGDNIIDVMDANDPMERAALKWIADARMGRERMATQPPANDEAAKDEPDAPPVKPPAKKDSRKKDSAQEADTPADEPVKPKNDLAKYSKSGKLSAVAIYDDKQMSLVVAVDPSLNGPITVTITDEADKVVATKEKKLKESEPSFAETFPLTDGKYTAVVASAARQENKETITLGPFTIVAAPPPPAEMPVEFAPNDFKQSKQGHLSAAVTRINGLSNLKVHLDGHSGFKVKVLNAKGEEVESRTYSNPNDANNWDLVVKAADENHKIIVSSLNEKESVELAVPKDALLKPADPIGAPATPEAVEYDWGRVRGYFAGGLIFSKEREDFSKSDMFLDFTLDKNYVAHQFGPFKDFNTFFNARLTSIPVATAENAATGDGGGEGGGEAAEPCNTPDCEGFITSKKAALMQAGIYLPMYGSLTTWYRKVTRQDHSFRWEKNALFVAPLAKGGIMTITGDRETSEGQQFGGDDIFNFYSFGMMLGHYRLHARRQRDEFGRYLNNRFGRPLWERNPNIAPELISWLTISAGRWENFEIMVPTGQKNAMGEEIKVRERPWRIEALGRLKIPETPFIIGFDGNFGKGPDDLRFIFGTRFDIGKLMRTLKLAGQQDQVGQSAPPPAATSPTPPPP
jgi:hypothetical protein